MFVSNSFQLKTICLALVSCFACQWSQVSYAQQTTEEGNKQERTKEQQEKTREQRAKMMPEERAKAVEEMRRKFQQTKNIESAPASQSAGTTQKVVVQGKQNETEQRRISVAGKIIIGRDELDRMGDSTIGESMKRLPGVTMGGRPGRGGDVRMRGMGGGYTQILLNGERAPRGFSMESITPDQVERIEVMRGPVAEFSTQAIAGTINVVLREEFHPKDIDLKMAMGFEQDRTAPNISLMMPWQLANWNVALNGTLNRNGQHDRSSSHKDEILSDGTIRLSQDQRDESQRSSSSINFAPRFSTRLENGDSLNFQPFLQSSRSRGNTQSELTQTPVFLAPYAKSTSSSESNSNFLRINGNWQHRFEDGARLNMRLGGGLMRSESQSQRFQYNKEGVLLNTISDQNDTRDNSMTQGGKYTRPWGEDQTISFGWDLEGSNRNQVRTSLDNGSPQFIDSGDNLEASTRRMALFAQDEFDINAHWSAYAGVRWEGIRIQSEKGQYKVENTSSVINPIAHAVYRIPGWGKDQVRMSLTSSYRAPNLNDIIAVPTISPLNGPTRPDRTGNPDLKPESSRGIDFAFEHYLNSAGIMSANFFVRSIDNLIRRRTQEVMTTNGLRYVSSPLNIGKASVRGIELEAKFQTQEYFPNGPAFDVRSNYSRFWSNVDGIAGPNNRIDQQPTQTANFGIDYRSQALPLTLGGNINWTPAYQTQSSETQLNQTGMRRQLDLYALWKFNPNLKVRFSANNMQAFDSVNGSSILIQDVNYVQSSRARTYTVFNLRLEMKL